MGTIRKQLEAAGLKRLAGPIAAAALPSLRLTTGSAGGRFVGKLGGRPNLPKEIRWPVWGNEQPLSFIAQLDLAALPKVPGLSLPRTGSLFFFYDAVNMPWGFDPKEAGAARVIYSPAAPPENPPRAPHRDIDEEARFKTAKLSTTVEMSLPGLRQPQLRELRPTEEEFHIYLALNDPLNHPIHRMGGHANEIQGDLCLEAQLVSNGIYCGDTSGYAKGRKMGLDGGAADWQLLLQVDSESRLGMSWGDEGRIYFMIRTEDLQRRQFDRVWLILQCT